MRRGSALGLALGSVIGLGVTTSRATQPRDYMLDPPTPGTYANLDAYVLGAQASLENRVDLEPGMSQLVTRASGIMSLPYAEGNLNADARVFLFTLGGTVAYRAVHRNMTFEDGADASRGARRQIEADKDFNSQAFPYYEGRLRMTLPLDSFFMINTGTIRIEKMHDNSFDWFHANVHDGGMLWKFESTFVYRHRDFGMFGPSFRYLSTLKTNGDSVQSREGEVGVGFVLATRPGFVGPRGGNTDLFLLQTLFEFKQPEFGLHTYRLPMYMLAVYRVSLRL